MITFDFDHATPPHLPFHLWLASGSKSPPLE
jgi:hypothetical protein